MTTSTKRILIVDDEPALLRYFGRVLARSYQTVTARDGAEAMAAVQEHQGKIDLILCDVCIPDGSGLDLRDQIAQQFPGLGTRFTFMTGGSPSPDLEARIVAAGCPTLEKPIEPDVLMAHVNDRLRILDTSV